MPEKLSVDLHPIFHSDRNIDKAVRTVIFRAAREGIPLAEIIVGRGKGKLRNRVINVLSSPHIKSFYRSVEVDPGNNGRVLVHF